MRVKILRQNPVELKRRGYCKVSNRYRSVSRIDRPDWKEYMAEQHAPWDPKGQGMRWVLGLGETSAQDYYRRCHSLDKIDDIPQDFFRFLPGSDSSTVGFVNWKERPLTSSSDAVLCTDDSNKLRSRIMTDICDYDTLLEHQLIGLALEATMENWNALTKTIAKHAKIQWKPCTQVESVTNERPSFVYSRRNLNTVYRNVYSGAFVAMYVKIVARYFDDCMFNCEVSKLVDYMFEIRSGFKALSQVGRPQRNRYQMAQLGCKYWINMFYGSINREESLLKCSVPFRTIVTDIGRSIMSTAYMLMRGDGMDDGILFADTDEFVCTFDPRHYMHEAAPDLELAIDKIGAIKFNARPGHRGHEKHGIVPLKG